MSEVVNQFLEKTADEWAARWVQSRMKALSTGKRGKASGNLNKSFGHTTRREKENILTSIGFEDYGRFLDMVRLNYSHDTWGRNAFMRLEDWIKRKGPPRFVPGFIRKYGKVPARESAFINRVAWGIVKSRTNGFHKRVKWYSKAKGGGINDLFNQVAAGLPEKVGQELKGGFGQ